MGVVSAFASYKLTKWFVNIIEKQTLNQRAKKISKMPKGGALSPEDIYDYCLDYNQPQEVENKAIKKLLTKMLSLTGNESIVIIEPNVYLLNLIINHGVEKILESPSWSPLPMKLIIPNWSKLKSLLRKTASATANIGIMLADMSSVTALIVALSLLTVKQDAGNMYLSLGCPNDLTLVPKVGETAVYASALNKDSKTTRFIIRTPTKKQEILIYDKKGTYFGDKKLEELKLETDIRISQTEGHPKISYKTDKRLIPLKQRTKTLEDVKKLDESKSYEELEKIIQEPAQSRKNKIIQSINENENK